MRMKRYELSECPKCNGTGDRTKGTCSNCNGTGMKRKRVY